MGYYTTFTLNEVSEKPYNQYEPDYSSAYKWGSATEQEFVFSEGYNPFEDGCKWYDYEEDMKRFSKDRPDRVFLLEGVGEEFPDLWRCWFKNGESFRQTGRVIYNDFDTEKWEENE